MKRKNLAKSRTQEEFDLLIPWVETEILMQKQETKQ